MNPRIALAGLLLVLPACGGGGGAASQGPRAPDSTGEALYAQKGCAACHSVNGSASVGPTWKGLYLSRVKLSDGSVVTADEAYLRESILQPSAKTVRGFTPGLMETVIKPNSLPEEQVTALVNYIKSLK